MALFQRLKTRNVGAVIVGTDDDADWDNIINNMNPDGIEDASANITAMKVKADPYPLDVASLPTDLRGEIQRLRYQLDTIIGKTEWYEDPDTNLLLEFNKGADIASATGLVLGADGNYFDVTGTTTITSIVTRRVGSIVKLHFDGILTLTHHATDLFLPTEANITTAAGDEAEFIEYATGDWRCIKYSKASGASVAGGETIQVVNVQDGAVATGTTVMVQDDTIPQSSEGDEYMTLAITPTATANKLKIDVVWQGSNSSGSAGSYIAALFQDSTAAALAGGLSNKRGAAGAMNQVVFTHYMTAGSTNAITFKVRAGSNLVGTTTFNGFAGARTLGGVMASSITITETAV